MYPRWLFLLAMSASTLLDASAAVAAVPLDFVPEHFYSMRPDPRMCPSPMCGGYFVKRLNRNQTRCADGKLAAECYVAALRNMPASGLGSGEQVLLQGKIRQRSIGAIGEFGVFVIHGAWLAATPEPGSGVFVGIENNGIVCVTTPCFSYDEYVLNHAPIRTLSAIDLGGVGASTETEQAARKILAEGGVLIAAGVNQQTLAATSCVAGLEFVASQFYLPIP